MVAFSIGVVVKVSNDQRQSSDITERVIQFCQVVFHSSSIVEILLLQRCVQWNGVLEQ